MSDTPGLNETPTRFGGPPSLETVLAVLRDYQPRAREIGVELVGVVGSVARGDAGPDSDIDVVYDVIGRPTLFGLGEIAVSLEERLGRHVDLVGRRALKPERWAWMGRDLVVL